MTNYNKKYGKEGDSSLIRIDLMLPRAVYEKILKQKPEGFRTSFFISKLLEKALLKEKKK
ncbi:MAG: hypothetical protein ACHQYP_09125 [Nitrospiria bacterium]